MRLYLIRHGETSHNRNGVMQGHSEVPLSDLGIRQAASVARRMANEPVSTIYSSDLRRAAMTAAIVAAMTNRPLLFDPAFRERNPGGLTDRPYEECLPFFTDRDFIPPEGESFAEFEARIAQAFQSLAEREGRRDNAVCVVSHGMVCGAFLMTCLGYTFEERMAVSLPNASLTVADYDGDWKLLSIADTAHLEKVGFAASHPTGA